MATVSVLGPGGYSRPPYGSFAGKPTSTSGPKGTGDFTVLGPSGLPRPPYAGFGGKTAAPVNVGIDAGSSISGGYFSRKRWHAIVAAREAEKRALKAKNRKVARQAAEAIHEAREHAEAAAESERIDTALQGLVATATQTTTTAGTLRQLREIADHIARLRYELEDDDEAVTLLLLH